MKGQEYHTLQHFCFVFGFKRKWPKTVFFIEETKTLQFAALQTFRQNCNPSR
jgi:hypothetical protein